MTPIELVEIVAKTLEPLGDDLVFVGGAITGLLLTDPAAPATSSTKDVDVIVSVTTRAEYLRDVAARLKDLGLREDDSEDAPICRWRLANGIKLDLMPTDPDILGFSNRWFPVAFSDAQRVPLPSGRSIRIVSGPCFLATKLEAFRSRGNNDYMESKDIEDLTAVLHGREEIVAEVKASSCELQAYLAQAASTLIATDAFVASLEGHLPGEDTSRVLDRLEQLSSFQIVSRRGPRAPETSGGRKR